MSQTLGRRLYVKESRKAIPTPRELPFRLYLQHTRDLSESLNESNTLKLVRQHTTIPGPAPLDFASVPNNLDDSFETYILMNTLPSGPLSRCRDVNNADFGQMKFQTTDDIAQVRDIPNTVNPAMPIYNTLGEALGDTRILGGEPAGPSPDEASFSQALRFSDDPARRGAGRWVMGSRSIVVVDCISRSSCLRWIPVIFTHKNSLADLAFSKYTPSMLEFPLYLSKPGNPRAAVRHDETVPWAAHRPPAKLHDMSTSPANP